MLTKGGLVIVNFMCQLDWPWVVQIKHYFWVCKCKCFWMRLAFELVNSVK